MPFHPVLLGHRNMFRDGLGKNAQYTPITMSFYKGTLPIPHLRGSHMGTGIYPKTLR